MTLPVVFTHFMATRRLARFLTLGAFVLAAAPAQTLPPGLKNYLENQLKLTPAEMTAVTSGQSVAKALDTKGEELGVVGVVYVKVPPDYLFRAYAQFDKIEPAGALQYGRFSNPAKPADAAKLTLDPEDLKALRNCKPGDCDVMMPDRAIERFRNEVDWKSPNAEAQATALYRTMMANYMGDYQKRGDDALLTFHNRRDPKSIREGWQQLLSNTPEVFQATPQLAAYLREFPRRLRSDSQSYFFWIKSDTGMRPVTTAAHLVIHKETAPNGKTGYVFAAKSLFSNHYYRDALALRFLIPETADANPKAAFLVSLTRAHADGLTGMKASLIRGKLVAGIQKQTSDQLAAIKSVVEDWYRKYAPAAK